jgi:hypothetical protein
VVNLLTENIYAAASQGIVDYLYEYFGENSAPRRFFTTNNLVVPRAEFLELGGFDETFALAAAEDRDLCERWVGAGRDLEYAPDVVVDHAHALSFVRFNRQHFHYGEARSTCIGHARARALVAAPGAGSFLLWPHHVSTAAYWRLAWRDVGDPPLLVAGGVRRGYFYERIQRGWNVSAGDRPQRPRVRSREVREYDLGSRREGSSMSGIA